MLIYKAFKTVSGTFFPSDSPIGFQVFSAARDPRASPPSYEKFRDPSENCSHPRVFPGNLSTTTDYLSDFSRSSGPSSSPPLLPTYLPTRNDHTSPPRDNSRTACGPTRFKTFFTLLSSPVPFIPACKAPPLFRLPVRLPVRS